MLTELARKAYLQVTRTTVWLSNNREASEGGSNKGGHFENLWQRMMGDQLARPIGDWTPLSSL